MRIQKKIMGTEGKSNNINVAINALAAVWASVPTTSGGSAYGNGNAAGHSVEQVRRALMRARQPQ